MEDKKSEYKINIWITKELRDELHIYCKKNETTISQLSRKYWKDLLEKEKEKNNG